MDRLTWSQVQNKLQSLKEDRGITSRLRTQLRQLLLSELQNGPTARWTPAITVRARALGSLIVEWLRIHEAHYTLSVLASEIPCLADLPGLADELDSGLKKKEAEEVLVTLGMKSKAIIEEYESSSDSLFSCILRVAATWKQRLEFTQIPLNRYNSPGSASWSIKLQRVTAKLCGNLDQLPALYSAVHSIIEAEVEQRVAKEKKIMLTEQISCENRVKEHLKRNEELLIANLEKAEKGLIQRKELVNEQMLEDKTSLCQLMSDIHQQHLAVALGLQDLEKREMEFDELKKAWKKELQGERERYIKKNQTLLSKITEFEKERLDFRKQVKIEEKATEALATISDIPGAAAPVPSLSDIKRYNYKKQLKNTKEKGRCFKKATTTSIGRSRSPFTSVSTSSHESTTQSSGVTAAAWGRLKELREETKRTHEELNERRRTEVDSNSDITTSVEMPERPQALPSNRVFNNSQATYPTLHEGCHYETIAAERRQSNTRRFRHLISQGDQPARTKIPQIPEVSAAKKRLRRESDVLNNLIQCARQTSPSHLTTGTAALTRQEDEKTKRLDSLVKSIRSKDPQSEIQQTTNDLINEKINSNENAGEKDVTKKSRIPIFAKINPTAELLVRKHVKDHYQLSSINSAEKEALNSGESQHTAGKLHIDNHSKTADISLPAPTAGLLQSALDSPSYVSDGEIVSTGRT